MIGPVLSQEMLIGSRRNRVHVFRWLYAGWLILQLLWIYFQQSFINVAGLDESPVIARVATRFLALFVAQQMILLTLMGLVLFGLGVVGLALLVLWPPWVPTWIEQHPTWQGWLRSRTGEPNWPLMRRDLTLRCVLLIVAGIFTVLIPH